jgi:outer membrane protein OmpA-like peptidoglycan-associated protein
LPDTKVTIKDSNGKMIEEAIADGSGNFKFKQEIEAEKKYLISATRGQDYYDEEITFSTVGKGIDMEKVMAPDTTVTLTTSVTLKKNVFVVIDKGDDEITLENILYDLDKWAIRPDAAVELDKLIEYMQHRPKIKVELGSHTDVRGKDAYNMELSRKRAQSAVDYIVSKGINSNRIAAKGYGETDLRIKNAKNESEHQLNRRTTIRITER